MEQNQNPPIVGSDCSARSEALPYRSTRWNRDRLYDFELNGGGRACLADRQITDCDRIAFALRELSVLRYDVEPLWVDWTKPRLISSFEDSLLTCYGRRRETRLQRHLKSMYRRVRAVQPLEIDTLYTLYRAELMWRHPRIPFLREPYVFMFNGIRVSSKRFFRLLVSQLGCRKTPLIRDQRQATPSGSPHRAWCCPNSQRETLLRRRQSL